jgi:putative nucleotidyltransferase with HDIG domain
MEFSRHTLSLLKIISRFSRQKNKKLYLVGGYLRDILLSLLSENTDIDFCLKRGAIKFGRDLARAIKAGFVVLDKENGACRLIKSAHGVTYTLDFTDFRGEDLNQDLLHRDFTINTFAVELDKAFRQDWRDSIISAGQARRDLEAKVIRAANKDAFDEDPLRILRAFTFACALGFKIDNLTLRLIKANKDKLAAVSFERIRDELFKILDEPSAFEYVSRLEKLKILRIIFPEIEVMRNVKQGPYHHLDVLRHSLETLRQLEFFIKELKNNQEVQSYLEETVSSGRTRRALIKLGALLHDIGKPKALRHEDGKTKFHGHERAGLEFTETIARRLRLSNDESEALKKMVFLHLRPGYLADNDIISPRAKFRYFRDSAKEAISILLLSVADQRSTRGPLTDEESHARHEKAVAGLIKEYFKAQKAQKPPRLINGHDLIKKFRLKPSPIIGRILREVEELQAIGKVKTKEAALKAASRLARV